MALCSVFKKRLDRRAHVAATVVPCRYLYTFKVRVAECTPHFLVRSRRPERAAEAGWTRPAGGVTTPEP